MTSDAAPAAAAAEALAAAFGAHARRWAERHLGSSAGDAATVAELAGFVARAVSLATSAGHVCARLADIAGALDSPVDLDALRRRLLDSGVVGVSSHPASHPLVLDDEDRIYLHRYFDYECRLAARLRRACSAGGGVGSIGTAAERMLRELFPGAPAVGEQLALWSEVGEHSRPAAGPRVRSRAEPGSEPDWQQVAVALALTGSLAIVSGGPGTGKTSTVVALLACLLAEAPEARVALAAPTGKAAARMLETVRARAAGLPPDLARRLPGESFTVHRLLGVDAAGGFRHHRDNPLPIDVLVVDEASMLDLALAVRLLEAVPDSARIVLLGDKDQLAAVEAGAVFSELGADPSLSTPRAELLASLCGVAPARLRPPSAPGAGGLPDSVVWLQRAFRFGAGSPIAALAADITAGRVEAVIERLHAAAAAALLGWLDDGGASPSPATIRRVLDGYAPYFDAVRAAGVGDAGAAFAAFARFRVLCALREGPRGAGAINDAIARTARSAFGAHGGEAWYAGRPVQVQRNDYALSLFNGDVGIALPDASGRLAVFFPAADGAFRSIAPTRLPVHATAFATTVHQAQGSEFDRVLLLLPSQPSRVVTRELLYTAVTRARVGLEIAAPEAILAQGVATRTERDGGLGARLREGALISSSLSSPAAASLAAERLPSRE